MAGIELGNRPHELTVWLRRAGDFVAALVADQPWPAGIGVELRFLPPAPAAAITWPATVAGTRISWDQQASASAAVLNAGARTAELHYTEADGTRLVWAAGRVRDAG